MSGHCRQRFVRRGDQANFFTIGLQLGFGVFQVAPKLRQPFIEPLTGLLLHVEARIKVGRDVRLCGLIRNLGGQERVRAFKADLYQLRQADRHDVQIVLEAGQGQFLDLFIGEEARFAVGTNPFAEQAGATLARVKQLIGGQVQRGHDALGNIARLHELGLGLEGLTRVGRRADQRLDRQELALVVLDHHRRGGAVDRRHHLDNDDGQRGDQRSDAQDKPLSCPDDVQVGAKGRCGIAGEVADARSQAVAGALGRHFRRQ